MRITSYSSVLLLSLLAYAPLPFADTNAAGVELLVAEDEGTENPGNMPTMPLGEGLQLDSTLRITPEAPETTQNADLWQRIRNGFGMPDLESPYTALHESWYASRPDYVKRMVERSQRYLYHVVEEVQKRGMPTEIALLPMVESAFNPQAYSRSKASGIWQFVPSTGKHFGLQQNWWKDNRRDILAATDAALDYLEKLHVMFGTWELALAAYNAGEGTVQRAIERNRKKGLPTDYQSLPLPQETRNYVPKLQAVKNIVSNPQQYGLDIAPIPDQPYFTKVRAPATKMDVHVAAKLAQISVEEFTALNPAYNRPLLAGSGEGLEIILPLDRVDDFEANLANYDQPLASWQTYHPRRGERLNTVSRKFGISTAQLCAVNGISPCNRLKPGQTLLVPARNGAAPQEIASVDTGPSSTKGASDENSRHRVRQGETVFSIAKRYGLSPRQLMALNGLKNGHLRQGQTLIVAGDVTNAPSPGKIKSRYTVKRGETLASIAKKFNVAASDIRRWNKLGSKNVLTPGRQLIILREEA